MKSAIRVCSLTCALLFAASISLAAPQDNQSQTAPDQNGQSQSPANQAAQGQNTQGQNTQDQNTTGANAPAKKSKSKAAKVRVGPPKGEHVPDFNPLPATTGGPGLFTVETGQTLPKKGVSFSAGVNKFSRQPGSITVLDTGLNIGYGLTNRFEIYAQFDGNRHVHVDQPGNLSFNTPANGLFPVFGNTFYRSITPGGRPAYVEDFPFAFTNGGGIGDVAVGLKIGLFSEDRGDPVSFSINNTVFIPTKQSFADLLDDEVQSGQLDYQLGMQLSKGFFSKKVLGTVDVGWRFTPDARFTLFNSQTGTTGRVGVVRGDQLRPGAGLILLPDRRLEFMTEYTSVVYLGDHTPNTSFDARDPIDGVWGIRFYFTKWLGLDAGYRYSLNLDHHRDRNGFVAKISAVSWPAKPPEPDVVTVSLSADKNSVQEGSNEPVQVTAMASDTYNYPLTYTWTATGGKIDGSGPTARWDSTGTTPGKYTVSVKVDNGHGQTSDSSVDLTVNPKPAPPAPPTMSCAVDRSTVLAGERAQITATVNDQSGTPLAYTWQTNGGKIEGTGATVQLDTTGAAPGSYTVTGRVENGKGGAADCSASVTVQAPPPPPQAAKINQCSFRRGIARVDNVCKRVLDDVAVRLQNEPNSRVLVIGYADPKEPHAAKLAADRAANAKKYLAQQKGVSDTRVETRTGTGAAGAGKDNYRIDIVLVPQGATY